VRWAWLLLATGCGSVFDLEPVEELPFYGSVVNDPTGDVDEDGDPNATDLCVLIPATELGGRADTDGDGVGDLCDPEPNKPGNCLALFDSFAAPTLSPHWRFEGDPVEIQDSKLHIPGSDETILYLDTALTLDAVYVDSYIHIGANAGGPRHAIQVLVDTTLTPLVNGHACGVESDSQSSMVSISTVTAGVDSSPTTASVGDLLVGAGTNLDILSWTSAGCHAVLSDGSRSQEATVAGKPPASGVLGIRVLDAGIDLYTVAGYGRGC
jgi:hypothetical protein